MISDKIWLPGWANSIRINIDIVVPKTPETAPKIKYKTPISLWLVENNVDENSKCYLITYTLASKKGQWKKYINEIINKSIVWV
jgi:hypothetical protein